MSEYPNLIKGFAIIKKAAAQANNSLGILSQEKTTAIIQACDEIYSFQHLPTSFYLRQFYFLFQFHF